MQKRLLVVVGVLVVSSLAGCLSVAPLATARPLGKGNNAIIVAASVLTRAEKGPKEDLAWSPMFDVAYRRGITDHVDFGFSVHGTGQLSFDAKFNLVNKNRLSLSIDPGVGGLIFPQGERTEGQAQFDFPLLLDITMSDMVRMTLALRYCGLVLYCSPECAGNGTSDRLIHAVVGTAGILVALPGFLQVMPFVSAVGWSDEWSLYLTGGLALRFVF